MNREETRRRAEVMLAYAEGEDVEFRVYPIPHWQKTNNPTWEWATMDYRISQKPETVTLYYVKNPDGAGVEVYISLSEAPAGWKVVKTETIELEAGE